VNEYPSYDAVGLAELVARGEVTGEELLAAARERAAAVNPSINAIVADVEPPESDPAHPGAFAGVPFLLKDLVQSIAGVPTSNGCKALRDFPMPVTTTGVQRFIDAGLQIFGKTNTPEFGAKAVTEPEALGPCRNPLDPERTPGGSSGGAAAAVAAGIVPVAAASDGGGSIRIPAACCGLFGLKPSRGLVPAGPLVGEALHGFSVQGVISRSVRDTAAMLDVLAGPDASSPYATAVPARPLALEVGTPPGRLRIGVGVAPEPTGEARAALEAAIAVLEELGHSVEPVAPPYDPDAVAETFLAAWFVNAAVLVERIKLLTGCGDEGFEEDTLRMAERGRPTTGIELWNTLERRQEHVLRLAAFHADYDLLLTPTLAYEPPPIGHFDDDAEGEAMLAWVPYTQLANLTGRPAMSFPIGRTGVQFVAPLRGEATLIRLASQLEAAQA
jgi:Asp-tRNA(Asn)/Glu-tRNA(Gln) amidotransferase A subunit family amidase